MLCVWPLFVLTDAPKAGRVDERLADGLAWHWKQDSPWRDLQQEILRSYSGRTTYPDNARDASLDNLYDEREIVNLTMQAVESYTLAMAANRPRAQFSSPFAEAQPFAAHFQRTMDRYFRLLSLEQTAQDVVRDACMVMGVACVHHSDAVKLNPADPSERFAGYPYVSRIPLRRLVRDTEADSLNDSQFIGHLYSLPYRQAIKDRRFPRWARKAFRESGPDDDREEDRQYRRGPQRIEDQLYFVDCYIRSTHEIRTYWVTSRFEPRIKRHVQRVECRTVACPYHVLNLGPVPDKFYPSSPAQNLRLLNDLYNSIYRKLEDQARVQKTLIKAGVQDEKDLETVRMSENGDVVALNSPHAVEPMNIPGPDQNMLGMLVNTQNQYSRSAGNLDSRLGLGASAETARQESMIGAMASRLEAYQQQRFVCFMRNIVRDVAKLVYEHPSLEIKGSHQIGQLQVSDNWRPGRDLDSRPIDFAALTVDIDPYSMAYKSPSERAAEMDADLNMFLPVAPMFAQQGARIDLKEVIEERSRLRDAPWLRKMWKFNQEPQQLEGSTGGASPQREYIHRNVSGGGNGQPDPLAMMQQNNGAQSN